MLAVAMPTEAGDKGAGGPGGGAGGRRGSDGSSKRSQKGADKGRGSRRRRRRQERSREAPGGGEAEAGELGLEVSEQECVVCFCAFDNLFKTPKLLACGHTFCLECLARINVASACVASLPCPVCRAPTPLPHGRDLTRLATDARALGRRHPLSVRFSRSRGRLFVRGPGAPRRLLALPGLKRGAGAAGPSLEVGRPPSRVPGRLRRFFRSDGCYYGALAVIVLVIVVLLLLGVLAFLTVPGLGGGSRPTSSSSSSAPNSSGSQATSQPNP